MGHIIRLVSLAGIWGGSFIFMKVLAPVFGPILTANLRVSIAGIALLIYCLSIKFDLEWKKNWKHYVIIGGINSALPFYLYSFAALHITASYEVILNATSPLFGAILARIWLKEKLGMTKIFGIMFGLVGVTLIVGLGSFEFSKLYFISIFACLVAAICYGIGAIYVKHYATGTQSLGIATASQIMAGLILTPFTFINTTEFELNFTIVLNVLGLALLCSSIAYLLYYRLIKDLGATKALTVTFLMPVFGMIWGHFFLGEQITIVMLFGCFLILIGTGFVLGLKPSQILPKKFA